MVTRRSADRTPRGDPLDHDDLHAALRRALQDHFVHEAADQEDAAPARLQQVLGRQWIGDRLGSKPGPSSRTRMTMPEGRPASSGVNSTCTLFVLVALVAMLDGIDDRLAHGDADPVQRLVVEPGEPPEMVARDLDEIEHLEGAVEIEMDAVSVGHQSDGL